MLIGSPCHAIAVLVFHNAQLFFWHGEDKWLGKPSPSPLCSWNERQSLLLLLKPVAPSGYCYIPSELGRDQGHGPGITFRAGDTITGSF